MDLSDGAVCFRISCPMSGSKLSPMMVEATIVTAISTMRRFYPGLSDVILFGENAERSYTRCMGNDEEEAEVKEAEDDEFF